MGLEIETEVEESDLVNDFEILEVEGRYHFGIDGQDDSKESKGGLPMSTLSLKVLEGPAAGSSRFWVTLLTKAQVTEAKEAHEADPSDDEAKKRYRSLRFQFSNMVKFLTAIGLNDGSGSIKFNTDDFVGKEFDADVTVEVYPKEGEDESNATGKRNALKIVLGDAPAAPADATDAAPADDADAETEEQKAEREATEAAEAEAAAAAAAEAEAAEAAAKKPKPGLKKPPVKPPLKALVKPAPGKAPAKAPAKAAPAKHSFARR